MQCDICEKEMASFTSMKNNLGKVLVVCPNCEIEYDQMLEREEE
jgi:transcription elongation factor Elf1